MDDRDADEHEEDDQCRAVHASTHTAWSYAKLMLLSIALLMVVGLLGVRLHNSCIAPFVDALKEQSLILRNNTINYNKKCIDPAVKASYDGFDNCIAHESVMKAGYYYPALQIYLRKMDPCSDRGCLHVEMNAFSWLMFIVPVGFGLSSLLLAVVVGVIVVGLHRALNARYELPNRMPTFSGGGAVRRQQHQTSKRDVKLEGIAYPPPLTGHRSKMNDVI